MGTNSYSVDSDGINDPQYPNPTVPEKKTQGFEAIFAIAGLRAVAYFLGEGGNKLIAHIGKFLEYDILTSSIYVHVAQHVREIFRV